MKSEPLDFLGLIGGKKIFKIPVFQRIYSWEKSHLEALWLDILSQYSKIEPHWNSQHREDYIKKIPKHYLGTMVMSGDGAVGIPKFEIIDGQQRITTIMTMIAALRDAKIKTIDKKDKESIDKVRNNINDNYLINSYADEGEKLRLILQKKDARAFKSVIENDSNKKLTRDSVGLSLDESDAVLKTYNYFLKQFTTEKKELVLEDETKNVELDRFAGLFPLNLEILEQIIVRRLSFISILGSSEVEDLNAIFESLNFKGKDLRQLDLLKNYIFMLLGSRADSAIQDYWSKIEMALPDPADQEFFVWACMVSEGKYEMQNRLYREIQTQLRVDGATTDNNIVVIKYLDGLTRKVSHFTNFVECKHPNKEINDAFIRLKKAGDRISVPVVLWLYSLTTRNDFSEKDFVKGCKIIEAFLIRRFLAGQASNNLNSMFGRALKTIFENKSSKSSLDKLTEALSEWCPTNESVVEGIKTSTFYKFGKPIQRIFILGSLDKRTDMQTMRNYEESDNSIEHIFPQTVNKDWDLAFISAKDEYESLKTTFCHTLGNLTLVKPGENSEVKNWIIDEKLKKYEKFEYSMTRKIPQFYRSLEPKSLKWGKREIIERAELLGQQAIEIWPGLDKV